ncbi:uncharacterized protein LOC116982595 [Amblyraja radiata]|uniref:uncharacterized protein LOC116982595 n=1 Tax=Amblyraja radiata TaxID=386614 RepID=UPI001402D414|nr:uncharacterized protein LOC116982595 [Amblyraja radiata]
MSRYSKQEVYQNFLDFYQKALASGNLSPCTGEEQVLQGRLFLNSVTGAGHRFQFLDFYRLALDLIESKDSQDLEEDGFRGLSKAFELLEMLAVNLYMWPWRKEIKSIKTFTGAFVYFIQPVFPPGVLREILEKLGYVQKGGSEFVMAGEVNEEAVGQLGFEFFLARAECEVMQEMLGQAPSRRLQDIVQLRCGESVRQDDGGKRLGCGSAGAGEGAGSGNEGAPQSDEFPAPLHFPDHPLPLAETNAGGIFELEARGLKNDPLTSLLPDSIDLYSDAVVGGDRRYLPDLAACLSPGELGQCNSLLVLDKSLVDNARAETLGKLAPRLNLYSSSILLDNCLDGRPSNLSVGNLPDGRPLRKTDNDAMDQKPAIKQEYPDEKRSGKSPQNKSSPKCGGFTSGTGNSQKRECVSAVEIQLKNRELEMLSYPTAETVGPAVPRPMDDFASSESQGPGRSPREPPGARVLWLNQRPHDLQTCQRPGVAECCLCSPVEIVTGQPLMDGPEFGRSSAQESGGSVVREPPQSFYIPPSSLESRPLLASPQDPRPPRPCPDCRREHLHEQELVIGGSGDPYIYVSKLAGQGTDGEGWSTRCNHYEEDV